MRSQLALLVTAVAIASGTRLTCMFQAKIAAVNTSTEGARLGQVHLSVSALEALRCSGSTCPPLTGLALNTAPELPVIVLLYLKHVR
jgi:hypothetical protein